MGELSNLLIVFWSYANNRSVEVFTQEIKAIMGDWKKFKVNGKSRDYRYYKAFPNEIRKDATLILENPDNLTLCV